MPDSRTSPPRTGLGRCGRHLRRSADFFSLRAESACNLTQMLKGLCRKGGEGGIDMQMETSLRKELEVARAEKEGFVAEFSEHDFDYIVNGWQVGFLATATER